jgi:pimeloyl-ACP methyl ester carboxylesterase
MNDKPYSDEVLIENWPGFTNHYATVNGVTLHYVTGGTGEPLICLPGWPQNWYSFKNVALPLAAQYRVIVVDIRGMGSSAKPLDGYDKKTMAADIYQLCQHLGLGQVSLLGHDIGGMVAMSFAFNYPAATAKLIVADGMHPSEGMMHMPLIPAKGTFNQKMDANQPYAWWMSFNQVKGLPEKLLEGRFQYLLEWLFNYVMIDANNMSDLEVQLYASLYNDAEQIRAANGWYQTFTQDIEDSKHYAPLTMPVLGLGSYVSSNYMKMAIPMVASNAEVIGIMDSGHYLFEEKPEEVIKSVSGFLG